MELQEPMIMLFWLGCAILGLVFGVALMGEGKSEPISQPSPRNVEDEDTLGYIPPRRPHRDEFGYLPRA